MDVFGLSGRESQTALLHALGGHQSIGDLLDEYGLSPQYQDL